IGSSWGGWVRQPRGAATAADKRSSRAALIASSVLLLAFPTRTPDHGGGTRGSGGDAAVRGSATAADAVGAGCGDGAASSSGDRLQRWAWMRGRRLGGDGPRLGCWRSARCGVRHIVCFLRLH
ncbi:unnamed protein product, partial [Urochloa humidicola]